MRSLKLIFLLPAILLLAMLPVNAKVNQPAITRYSDAEMHPIKTLIGIGQGIIDNLSSIVELLANDPNTNQQIHDSINAFLTDPEKSIKTSLVNYINADAQERAQITGSVFISGMIAEETVFNKLSSVGKVSQYSKWKEFGLPSDGYFSKMIAKETAEDLLSGKVIDLAGSKGAGFIGRAEELRGIRRSSVMRNAMGVKYNPDYVLEFQLKDTTGLQNLLQYDDPLFRVGGKTLTGYSEYNMPSLTSENIENWILRRLDK